MPMAFVMKLASPLGVSLVGKVRPRVVIAASTLIGGLALLLYVRIDPRSTPLELIIPMSVMAFGLGLGMSQRTSIIASVVPVGEIGVASSILALVRNVASAFGTSVFATILTDSSKDYLVAISRFSSVTATNPLVRGQIGALMVLKAQIDGYRMVFWIVAGVMFVAAVLAMVTLNTRELNREVGIIVE